MVVNALYTITHRESGKTYVGWTSLPVELRWEQHRYVAQRSKSRSLIHKAIAKHGSDSFDWEVVSYFDTEDEAKQAEIYWIDRLGTNVSRGGSGYNLTDGGDGVVGHKCNEKTKAQISATLKGREFSPEHRKAISEARKGKRASLAHRRYLSEIRKGKAPWNKGKKIGPNPKLSVSLKKYFAEQRED